MTESANPDFGYEGLSERLDRCLTARCDAAAIAALFDGSGATMKRTFWGGSGSWRATFTTADGTRAVFEFDVGDRLRAYGVARAGRAGGKGDEAGLDIPLIFIDG